MSENQPFNLSYIPVDKNNVGLLRRIHRETLPVHYGRHIYKMFEEGKIARGLLVYLNDDLPIGEICWRIEEDEKDPKIHKIYLMTIGVLHTYQRRGIAKKLLQHIIDESKDIDEIFLHVLYSNEVAMKFYEKFGFTRKEFLPGYYKALEVGDAYIYSMPITKKTE
ncbi:acetyltransferase, GNAT family protein [Trichomonas vaginalis G3]|uniref:Acetyltransferase, GNAT family protein n=1 Tax=Trichomonas vaginalis (strain ATCC PRA-98 / G3) TaxID=412133 RepID=A2EXQ1_TRIV3|nr:peptide alpha-N-acetyltransferase protein [Trichomonas vaginalis G3]EAY02561.1 acetyltransferase, GNAT family protein [Trichomonas vaginalis G3]KAI5552048.1 peptide alpha-N-acetyltransferase protein [Trichomonas vaginalis G3]|eukprot:XP_001330697.1 acetyltransferase, GNAT family protein [Trichomonas vaginalis G3]